MALIPMELAKAGLDDNGVLWPYDELSRIADRFQQWQERKPDHKFPVRAGMLEDGPIIGYVRDMTFHANTDSLQVTVDTSIAAKFTCNHCKHETYSPNVQQCSQCGGDDLAEEPFVEQANALLHAGRLVCFVTYDSERFANSSEYRNMGLARIGVLVQTGA